MDHGGESDFAFEMTFEVRMAGAVLLGRPVADAVGEGGLKQVERAPGQVGMGVEGEAGEVLADGWSHQTGFAEVGGEALVEDDGEDMVGEAVGAAGKVGIARKG